MLMDDMYKFAIIPSLRFAQATIEEWKVDHEHMLLICIVTLYPNTILMNTFSFWYSFGVNSFHCA